MTKKFKIRKLGEEILFSWRFNLAVTFITLVLVVSAFYLVRIGEFDHLLSYFVDTPQKREAPSEGPLVTVVRPSPFKPLLSQVYFEPKRLEIPSAALSVQVEGVTVTEDGTLGTPADWQGAGWYTGSSRPAEHGNMIVNAHYDDTSGRPAAFWNLKKVKVGDEVLVSDSVGRQYAYQVEEVKYISMSDPDRLDVLADSKSERLLTLITCGGVWVPGEGYNKRLVVVAEFSPETLAVNEQ